MLIVPYLRVSSSKQGASGLGLEAQRAAVQAYASAGGHRLLQEFVEVESGAKSTRPELQAALASCRLHRATLVIAKLDRLARNLLFIANLMESDIDFVACDMPAANRLTLHLLAAIAEHERQMISERTKSALQAAKARGVRLGNPAGAAALMPGSAAAAIKSAVVRREKAEERRRMLSPALLELEALGCSSNQHIALELNRRGISAPAGGVWHPEQVRRIRIALASSC